MKKVLFIMTLVLGFIIVTNNVDTKENRTLPSVKIKDMQKKAVDTKDFDNDGKPIVIMFWATWCKPCLLELKNIAELYPDWQDETGVKIIAISIDDSRNSRKVPGLVNGRGWEYEVYLDENSDFKRAMNVTNPPHTFLLNGKGEIVWEHNGYAEGNENILYNEIKKLVE